MYYKIGR